MALDEERGGDEGGGADDGDDGDDDDDCDDAEDDGRPHLPPSLVPRVHALLVRKLGPSYPALQPAPGPVASSGAFALQPAGVDDVGGQQAPSASGAAGSRGAAMQLAAAASTAGAAGAPAKHLVRAGVHALWPRGALRDTVQSAQFLLTWPQFKWRYAC
jgi:hypothetical protein